MCCVWTWYLVVMRYMNSTLLSLQASKHSLHRLLNILLVYCWSCHRATMVIAVRAHCNPFDTVGLYVCIAYLYVLNVYVFSYCDMLSKLLYELVMPSKIGRERERERERERIVGVCWFRIGLDFRCIHISIVDWNVEFMLYHALFMLYWIHLWFFLH